MFESQKGISLYVVTCHGADSVAGNISRNLETNLSHWSAGVKPGLPRSRVLRSSKKLSSKLGSEHQAINVRDVKTMSQASVSPEHIVEHHFVVSQLCSLQKLPG